MTKQRPDLTVYQVAYLAGGPGRVAETATAELLRRGLLQVQPTGLLAVSPGSQPVFPEPSETGRASTADHGLEQRILCEAGRTAVDLPGLRRRCAAWQPVRQLAAGLATTGLTLSVRQRRSALVLAIVLLTAAAAAAAAIAAGWRAAPTARSPLGAAIAVLVVGLLLRARQRATADGRRQLAETARLTELPARPPKVPRSARTNSDVAAGPAAPAPEEVAQVALTGLGALRDPELRARLSRSAPRASGAAGAPRLRRSGA